MKSLILMSFADFKRYWKKYLAFSFLYLLLSSYILIPFLSYFLNRLLLAISSGVLLNKSAFSLLLDPIGILGLIILSSLAVIFIFIEIGTLIIITHENNFNNNIFITEGIFTTVKSIKEIMGFGIIHLALLLLLIIPIVNIPIMPEISSLIRLPNFFIDNILSNFVFKSIYLITLILLVYLLTRLIFTLHEVLIEKQKVWQAMKNSLQLTKKISISILFKLIIFDILIFAAGVFLFFLLSYIPNIFTGKVNYLINNYFITMSSFITLVYSLMLIPLNIIFVSKLYYKAKNKSFLDQTINTYNLDIFEKLEKLFFNLIDSKRSALAFILIINILASFYIGYFTTQGTIYAGRDVLVISHKGVVDGEFENSLTAIRASMAAEVDAVGMDVQLTKDNEIVLNHDRSLRRTLGLPYNVRDLTYEELINLDVTMPSGFLASDKILPTLDEALATIDGEMDIHIDVKTNNNAKIFAEKIVNIVEENDMVERAFIQSFDRNFLARIKELNPEIITCQIFYYALGNLAELEADYFTVYHGILDRKLVKNARKADKGIWVWTVNTEEDIKNVLQYDIDGIITDHPLLVKGILGRRTLAE